MLTWEPQTQQEQSRRLDLCITLGLLILLIAAGLFWKIQRAMGQ